MTIVRRRSRCGIAAPTLRLARDETGSMTVFACFMILILLMVGGIGVDLMRNEMERTRLQSLSDRAVLAAADLDQTLDPEAVVRDYFAKAGMAGYVSTVKVDDGLNYREVAVEAAGTMDTQFMHMLGVNTLPVPASALAEERVNKVEISLVLDISGSMNDGTKMADMQGAAGEFIDSVLDPANEDLVSVSLVPYSEHVNAGPLIFDRLSTTQVHNYSHCIEFRDHDFNTTVLDKGNNYAQMQHFQWNYHSIQSGTQLNTRYDTVCPRNSYERIVPLSQDAAFLKQRINQLRPRAGTQIFLGMKWATAMLDPSFQSLTDSIASAGYIDDEFRDRPAAYSDADTLKTIVLMTDGQNSNGSRIAPQFYNSESEIAHWNSYNLWYYLNYNVHPDYWRYFYYTKYTESRGDQLLNNMCNAAKASGVVVWTIGFEVQDHGANVMERCASSPAHFYRVVGGNQISDAFNAIAKQINHLRLTQ